MKNNGKNNKQQIDLVFGFEQTYIKLKMQIPQQERHYKPSNTPRIKH